MSKLSLQVILNQVDLALERYNKLRSRSQYDACSDQPDIEINEVLTILAATIDRLAPPGSRYLINAHEAIKRSGGTNPYLFTILPGILTALRNDYIAGHLQSLQEIIHAEVFSDFLEMATYLLEEGYKDPSAVLTGGVLEEHIRKLCEKNNIATIQGSKPIKADTLNAELVKANIYSKLDQKNVTAWLDLRNKAAHGKYNEYSKEQVALLIQSVRDFFSRNPA